MILIVNRIGLRLLIELMNGFGFIRDILIRILELIYIHIILFIDINGE